MSLEKFLKLSKNSLVRERLLRHKFLFDISLAAMRKDYTLEVFRSEVDVFGYDLLLSDGNSMKFIQLKSIIKGGKAQAWNIQKGMFRPDLLLAKAVNYDIKRQPVGLGGGIVLQEFEVVNGDLKVEYYYTDLNVFYLFSEGILKLRSLKPGRPIFNIALLHSEGSHSQKLKIPKSLFIKATCPDGLLGLMGYPNIISKPSWTHNLIQLINERKTREKLVLQKRIKPEILKLAHCRI